MTFIEHLGYCFLAALTAGLASSLTNGSMVQGEGVFSFSFVFKRIIISVSTGFPVFFLVHKYDVGDETIIVIVWVAAFIADQALPHLKKLLMKYFMQKVEEAIKPSDKTETGPKKD